MGLCSSFGKDFWPDECCNFTNNIVKLPISIFRERLDYFAKKNCSIIAFLFHCTGCHDWVRTLAWINNRHGKISMYFLVYFVARIDDESTTLDKEKHLRSFLDPRTRSMYVTEQRLIVTTILHLWVYAHSQPMPTRASSSHPCNGDRYFTSNKRTRGEIKPTGASCNHLPMVVGYLALCCFE